jgi:hypothetical protein
MEPIVRVVAGLLVVVGMVGTIWAMALRMRPGVRPGKLMIAAPLCMMIGFALLLGIS